MGTGRLQALHVCVAGLSLAGVASKWQAAQFSGVLWIRHAIVSSDLKALSGHVFGTSSPRWQYMHVKITKSSRLVFQWPCTHFMHRVSLPVPATTNQLFGMSSSN